MESVIRAIVIYFFLVLVFRMSGKRSLGQVTSFDFVLLLIIAEVTQQALTGDDYSLTNAVLLILTLIGLDVGLSLVKQRYPRVDVMLEGRPLILVQDGKPIQERLAKERVDEEDILTAAREMQGLESIDQIKYAVLERHGGISIIPRS